MNTKMALLRPVGTLAMASALGLATVPALAQEEADPGVEITLRGYPMAIHQGTCETLIAEPAYDLGLLWPRPLIVAGEDARNYVGPYEGPYASDDFYLDGDAVDLTDETAFLIIDADDDGLLDYGIDLDDDDILATTEVLDRPILWASENELADLEGAVLDGDDAELADLRDTPHALVIHQGTITDTEYLACAEIDGAVDEDGRLATVLRPIGANGFTGIAQFEQTAAGFLGIGGDSGAADVYVFPARVAQAATGASGTPTP